MFFWHIQGGDVKKVREGIEVKNSDLDHLD